VVNELNLPLIILHTTFIVVTMNPECLLWVDLHTMSIRMSLTLISSQFTLLRKARETSLLLTLIGMAPKRLRTFSLRNSQEVLMSKSSVACILLITNVASFIKWI
jgi:hypothetical protein